MNLGCRVSLRTRSAGTPSLDPSLVCRVPFALMYHGSALKLIGHGYNMYDARRKCNEDEEGSLCYAEIGWATTWLNDPAHKAALGVNPALRFEACNIPINLKFNYVQGDSMRNGAKLLTTLIADGIRVLIYAGNAGMFALYFCFLWCSLTNGTRGAFIFSCRYDVQLHGELFHPLPTNRNGILKIVPREKQRSSLASKTSTMKSSSQPKPSPGR